MSKKGLKSSKKGSGKPRKVKKAKIKPRKRRLTGIPKIVKVLRKYYPKRYKTHKEALERARVLKPQMEGEKFTVANIKFYEREDYNFDHKKKSSKVDKNNPPYMPSKLLESIHYYDLDEYSSEIGSASDEITFVSKLFNSGVGEVKGGSFVDYGTLFSEFVSFCDESRNSKSEDLYNSEWYVVCSEPYYNDSKKRWESKIKSVDVLGNEEDYGYVGGGEEPYNLDVEKSKEKVEEFKRKKEKSSLEEPKPTEKTIKDKEIELEKAKQETLKLEIEKEKLGLKASYIKLFEQGVITKEELRGLLGL